MRSVADKSPTAREELRPKPCPEGLRYLAAWAWELFGRSGAGPAGLAPVSYPTINAWARMKGVTLAPHEVDALVVLDGAILSAYASKD